MRYRNHPGGRKHVFAVLAIVFIFSFPPLQAHAADGFFESLWCDITGLFGYECAPEIVQVVEHMPNGVATVTTTIPPAPEDADRYTASATPEGRVVYTTVENTYITNPVTLIRESSNSSSNGGGNGVSRDLLSRQLDVILENVGENIGNVQGELTDALADIAASLTTALLTVTGNANIGGDLQVTGTLTAGSLAVSSLSSGGAVVAPYFTATSSSASTFVGSVGIGTTSPYRTLTVVGSGTSAIHLESYGGANTFRGQRAGGTESVPTALSAGNSLSNFVGGGYDGTTFVDGASIVMSTQGTWSSTNHASLFQFKLTPTNSTTLTEALRLEADGSLRLATSSTYLQASALGAGSLIMQGMLGVGSSTPYAKLSITNTGAAPSFIVEDTTSPDSTPFIIDASGNVGIGTTSPAYKLEVYASGANTARFQNINQYNVVTLDNLSGNASLQNILRFNNNGSTAWSVGNDAANSNALTFASSALLDSGQRVVITTGGNVGIGTTTPATYLDVGGLNAGHLAQFGDGGGQTQYISINNSRAMFGYDNTGTAAVVQAAGGKGIEFFVNSNTFLGGTQAMTITSAGNVGVGTTSPWRTFGVTGTAGFDGLTGAVGAGSLCLSANKEMVYNSGSDNCLSSTRATKHDIESLSVNALDIVNALQPSSFVYNGTERTRYGFIAEDTASIDAILATYNEAGQVTGIDDRSILSVVVKAFQELYTGVMSRFAVQDTRIEALEARIRELEARQGIAAPQPPAPEPGPETDGEGTLPETSDESFGGEEMPPDTEESLAGTGQDASGGVGTEIPEPAPELPAP